MFDKLIEDLYNKKEEIHKVSIETLSKYVNHWSRDYLRDRRKLLYAYDPDVEKFIAVDNTTGECFVEEFKNEEEALKWLNEESYI